MCDTYHAVIIFLEKNSLLSYGLIRLGFASRIHMYVIIIYAV